MWEVTAASLTSQSTLPPAALSKWPPLLLCSQPENHTAGGGTGPGEMRLSRRCSSRPLFVCFGLNRSGEVECSYSVFYFYFFWIWFIFSFTFPKLAAKQKQKLLWLTNSHFAHVRAALTAAWEDFFKCRLAREWSRLSLSKLSMIRLKGKGENDVIWPTRLTIDANMYLFVD